VLERFLPDFIECQDSYNLPWAALGHRKRHPQTVLVGGYCTDFPTAYVRRFGAPWVTDPVAAMVQNWSYRYCGRLYRQFDGIYALSDSGGGERLTRETGRSVDILPFGIELDLFTSAERDEALRAEYGVNGGPLLVYAGRIDEEKRAPEVFEAFRRLPDWLGATLIMVGEGKERPRLMEEARGLRAHFPGFLGDRERLAQLLASADIYVSAMADETFGVSVVEAQAAGLPVVGVSGGAMIERVPPELGLLGPVGDPAAMAENIRHIWGNGAVAMGRRAREHVRTRFSWDRTFQTLFGEIYPKARAHRRQTLGS
jgi:alpha-1,6-mannosyltransferase